MQSRVFNYPNATVRVHIPDLADEERIKRMKEIKFTAEKLLKGMVKSDTPDICDHNDNFCNIDNSRFDV